MSREGPIVAILGMHRSGTSAAAEIVERLGVSLGDAVSRESRFQPRGNNENPRLIRLHERALERRGGSWWRPVAPVAIEPEPRELRRRDRILAEDYPAAVPIAIKEPRMLIALALWRDLDLRPIGVLRNPLSVRRSLQSRARRSGKHLDLLDDDLADELWVVYNSALLAELERDPFPLADFDRPERFVSDLAAALAAQGVEPAGRAPSLDPALGSPAGTGWRDAVSAPARELHDELRGRTLAAAERR